MQRLRGYNYRDSCFIQLSDVGGVYLLGDLDLKQFSVVAIVLFQIGFFGSSVQGAAKTTITGGL